MKVIERYAARAAARTIEKMQGTDVVEVPWEPPATRDLSCVVSVSRDRRVVRLAWLAITTPEGECADRAEPSRSQMEAAALAWVKAHPGNYDLALDRVEVTYKPDGSNGVLIQTDYFAR